MTDTNEQKTDKFIFGGEAEGEKKQPSAGKQPKEENKPDKWSEIRYRKVYQGTVINDLSRAVIFRKPPDPKQLDLFAFDGKEGATTSVPINKNLTLSFLNCTETVKEGGIEKTVVKPLIFGFDAHRLLTVMRLQFTEQVDHEKARAGLLSVDDLTINMPLRTYATILGKKTDDESLRNLRRTVNKALNQLYNVSIHYEKKDATPIKGKKKRTDAETILYLDTRIIADKGEIKNGVITASFAPRLGNYLGRSYIEQYPMNLLKVSTQNSGLPYFIGNILADQNNIPREAGRLPCIGVKTLVNYAVASELLPKLEEQREKGELRRRYIEPLEKALDALYKEKVITDWGYSKGSRNKLTDSEKANASFDDMMNMYIYFEMPVEKYRIRQRKGVKELENT